MKRVFICSPFSGDTGRNVRYARHGCQIATLSGCAPLAPHLLYPQFLLDDLRSDREMGIRCGLAFMAVCNEVWVGEKYGISPGMKREIKEARRLGIPVRYYK